MEKFTFTLSAPTLMPTTSSGPATSIPTFSAFSKMKREQNERGSSVGVHLSGSKSLTSIRPLQEQTDDLSKNATNAQEKYRKLEGRDKISRQKNPKTKVRVELAVKLVGSCPDMCPEKERYMRDFQRQLSSYETGPDGLVDHNAAIKAYSRSSADQEEPLPHELRPGNTLDMTLDYILHKIIPKGDLEDEALDDWYTFVWDRTRAIRKDITQQELCDLNAVALMEKCARFHIHCASRLCELDRHSFDPKLNDENLMKCLQSLEHMYSDLRLKGVTCPNEAEFTSYKILMHLQEGDTLWEVQQRPISIFKSPEVQLALRVHLQVFNKNFVGFFKLVKGASYMTSCILHRYFFQMRSQALRTLLWSSTKKDGQTMVGLGTAFKMLGYDNRSLTILRIFCQEHGIFVDLDRQWLLFNRKKFTIPEAPMIMRESYLIDSKLTVNVNEAINGGPLRPLKFHIPHNSFDNEGFLIENLKETTIDIPVDPPQPVHVKESPFKMFPPLKLKPSTSRELKTMKPFVPSSISKTSTKKEFTKVQKGRKIEMAKDPLVAMAYDISQKVAEQREEMAQKLKKEKTREIIHRISISLMNKITDGTLGKDLPAIAAFELNEAELSLNRIIAEKRKNAIIHLLTFKVYEKIQNVVVARLSRSIADYSITHRKIGVKFSTQATEKIISLYLQHSIPVICQEAIGAVELERAQRKAEFEKALRLAHLRYWFETWRENAKESKRLKEKRAAERHELLNNIIYFDPTKTDKEVYDSWVLGLPLKRKIDQPDLPCQKRPLRDAENRGNGIVEICDRLLVDRLMEHRKARLEERRLKEGSEERLNLRQLESDCNELRELIEEEKRRYDDPL